MSAFEELGLLPQLGEAVSQLNWELPTAIQCDAIPAILGGGDVLIAAETGSGKTGAFSLPVAQIMFEERREMLNPSSSKQPSSQEKSWRLNPRDRDAGLAIDEAGLCCESRAPKLWHGARSTAAVHSAGKHYYEVTIVKDGLCRVGWSTADATLNLGTDGNSYGFGGTGKKSHNKRFEDYGDSFTTGDVLGCCLDIDSLSISWSKNGKQFPEAFRLPRDVLSAVGALFPAVLLQTSALQINFGNVPFKHLPRGFSGVSSCSASNLLWKTEAPTSRVSKPSIKTPLCIILEPTLELVEQTFNNLSLFCSKLKDPAIKCVSVVGGGDTRRLIQEMEEGVEAVVGTPSRVCDMVESGAVPVDSLRFFVLDEADQILSQQNQQGARQLERLLAKIPRVTSSGARLQLIVCSATLHNQNISRFADRYMHFPAWIDLKGMDSVSESVHHVVCPVDPANDKSWIRILHSGNSLQDDLVHSTDKIHPGSGEECTLSLGAKILKGIYVLNAIQALSMPQAIIFCRTKKDCDNLETYLRANRHKAVCLHSDRSPEDRKAALASFKSGSVPFLICTDVAARGLDVQGVPYVINVTLPDDKLMYIHRIGRVGRADRMGLSISLVSSHREKVWYHSCPSRGLRCDDRRDKSKGGCTIWYNEQQLLADVEEHLGCTIAVVDSDFRIPTDELDGRVVYGSRRVQAKGFEGLASRLSTAVSQLADLERALQTSYWALARPAA